MAVFALLAVLMVNVIDRTSTLWRSSLSKSEQFRSARVGLETISRRIGTSVLNPYQDYEYPGGNSSLPPTRFQLRSDLRFQTGKSGVLFASEAATHPSHGIFFQAPGGWVAAPSTFGSLPSLLNTFGYFVQYTPLTDPLDAASTKWRYRLVEMREPSEDLTVFRYTRGNSNYAGTEWITVPGSAAANRRILADNVIGLFVVARDSDGNALDTNFNFSSATVPAALRNLLPASVEVVLVSIDEATASRVCLDSSPPSLLPSNLFTTAANFNSDLATLETHLLSLTPPIRAYVERASVILSPER